QRENINGWSRNVLFDTVKQAQADESCVITTYQKKAIILSLFSVFGCGNHTHVLPNGSPPLGDSKCLQQSVDMVGN
ncbi:uncharacterized protein V6R79_016364, partial [Siganus canaliculatus]